MGPAERVWCYSDSPQQLFVYDSTKACLLAIVVPSLISLLDVESTALLHEFEQVDAHVHLLCTDHAVVVH